MITVDQTNWSCFYSWNYDGLHEWLYVCWTLYVTKTNSSHVWGIRANSSHQVKNTCEYITYIRRICHTFVTFTFRTHTPTGLKTCLSHGTKTKKKVNKILFRRKHHTNLRIDDNKCDDNNSVGSGILRKGENMCMPNPLETWWKGTRCYFCSSVRVCVLTSVRKSLTSELLLVYLANKKIQNIKILIKLGFGYNPLNFVKSNTC